MTNGIDKALNQFWYEHHKNEQKIDDIKYRAVDDRGVVEYANDDVQKVIEYARTRNRTKTGIVISDVTVWMKVEIA